MKVIVHSDRIGEKLMDKKEFALKQHEDWHGKIEVVSRAKVTNREELSVAYTPGVSYPCRNKKVRAAGWSCAVHGLLW